MRKPINEGPKTYLFDCVKTFFSKRILTKCFTLHFNDIRCWIWQIMISQVFLFTIACYNTWWGTLWSFKWVFLPIVLKESTNVLIVWLLGSKWFIIFIPNYFLTIVKCLYFNKDENIWHYLHLILIQSNF